MDISFTPAPDVVVILNALLDKFENRAKRNPSISEAKGTYQTSPDTQNFARTIKVSLTELPLPTYFSQTDPHPRIIANEQLQELAKDNIITLQWQTAETNHLLQSVSITNGAYHPEAERSGRNTLHALRATQHESLYALLNRTPTSNHRANLESIILSEKFRFPKDDWRARALDYILNQLRTGKSPAPFSLTDSDFNLDLLVLLCALSNIQAETPHRVFSVRIFNDTKRFDDLQPALLRLARRANSEWKNLPSEDLLREFNLAANPTYIHLAGSWELTDSNGQILHLDPFTPSVGFSASQIASIQKITVHSESVLCIENLTTFHEFTRTNSTYPRQHATICLMGNPSPSIRRLIRLVPEGTPIYLWADMDYGGFNILSQLRKQVSPRVQLHLMDITTFNAYAHLARPLTQSDRRNLKRLTYHPNLKDIHPTVEHLLKRGLKLEQEAIQF